MASLKLNLGCGNKRKEGYLNCDISPLVKPDKIVNLEKKLPFKDNSVNEIYSRHVCEHIQNFIPLMNEFHRICKNGSKITAIVPYFSHPGASQDPSHKRFFTLNTFDYFELGNKLCFYGMGLFSIKKKELRLFISKPLIGVPLSKFFNKYSSLYERFFAYLLPATEIIYTLKVIK